MDVDNTNPTVGQGATDESALDDQLVAAFDEISESLPQNGADGDGDDGADGADGGDGSESSLDDDLGDGGTETDETDDPGDNDPGETDDDDAGQSENANDVPDAAGEGEPSEKSVEPEPPKPEPKPEPKPDRKTERKLKAVEEYAKSLGFGSVEEMLAEQEGVSAETVKARLESEELTVEEKAALYDAEHAKSKEAEKADAERRGREAVLQALYADFPTIKDTVKDLDKDIKNPDRFLKLLLAGNTPREAFLATGNVPPRFAPVPNGKAHLVPTAGARRGGGSASIPVADLAIYREEFPDLSDGKIEALYKKVSS